MHPKALKYITTFIGSIYLTGAISAGRFEISIFPSQSYWIFVDTIAFIFWAYMLDGITNPYDKNKDSFFTFSYMIGIPYICILAIDH